MMESRGNELARRAIFAISVAAAAAIWMAPPLWHRLQTSGISATALRLAWHLALYGSLAAASVGLMRVAVTDQASRSRRHFLTTAICLLLVTLLVRLPFWFQALINADEGGLIVVAQSWLDGHLPFTGVWDNKPPGAVGAMAALMSFGNGLWPIRAGGALIVFATAWLLTFAGRPRREGALVWAPLLLIVFVSAAEGGQTTFTEHFAMLPLAALLAVSLRPHYRAGDAALIGLLLAIAMLSRTNLAFAIPVGLAAVVWRSPGEAVGHHLAAFGAALAAPWAAIALLYAGRGEFAALVHGVVVVPFVMPQVSLAGMPLAISDLLVVIARHAARNAALLWIAAVGGLIAAWRSTNAAGHSDHRLAMLWLMSILLSILAMSAGEEHYLIVAMPFLAYFGGSWLERRARGQARGWILALIVMGFLVPTLGTPGRYAELARHLFAGDRNYGDEGHQLASYLRTQGAAGRDVYVLDDSNTSAWLAGARHASRFADPTQLRIVPLIRAYAGPDATADDELLRPFINNPLFVVLTEEDGVADVIAAQLQRDYQLVAEFGLHKVYRRRSGQ